MSLIVIKLLLLFALLLIVLHVFFGIRFVGERAGLILKHVHFFCRSLLNSLPKAFRFLLGLSHPIPRFMSAIAMAYVLTYVLAHSIAYIDSVNCLGWNCEEVYCPAGYAVEVPGKGYLPCDKFDQFVTGKSEVLLGR